MNNPIIKISTIVNAAPLKVWHLWTTPSHIVNWNFASPDWHTTKASMNLIVGGNFSSRMEAKDESMGFDFEGTITEVMPLQKLSYKMSDHRLATVFFEENENGTLITEEFEAEGENSLELQEMGWLAILNNFKAYAESYKGIDLHPCIWFDQNGKEAAEFYTNAIQPSGIIFSNPMTTIFLLKGNKLMALNGGPTFVPNPSISFMVAYNQDSDLESSWNSLIKNGDVMMPLDSYPWSSKYGFCQDQYKVSWQLIKAGFANTGQIFAPSFMFTQDKAGKAEEAMNFYTGIFPHSSIHSINRYLTNDEGVEGTVKHAMFYLADKIFTAMDSFAPHAFTFNEGVSLVIPCDTQDQIDYYWSQLTEGGQESMCGWLKDKYGISWQVVPSVLGSLLSDPDKGSRVIQSFLKMKKFDIETLLKA